ncbi:MAG TPA: LemA family protein [Planctomycetota bacterium]|nr:LemA family protein [Planctomycetota bacterium]
MTPAEIAISLVAATLLVVLAGYLLALYNSLIQVRNNIDKAWANIDVLLQQRHDELNNLVEIVRGYLRHERDLLDAVTRLRTGYNAAQATPEKVAIENQLNDQVRRIGTACEAYPDLKANALFQQLMTRLTALESSIADRREFFNDSINIYNIRIEQFPERLFAGLMRFSRLHFLETAPGERSRVDVALA